MKVKIKRQGKRRSVEVYRYEQGNGKHVVYLVEGDLLVTKGLFTSKIKATKEAKRVAALYGCVFAN
jgi:hypothetical protein